MWKKYKIEQFPIKIVSENKMLSFENSVNQILAQKAEGKDTLLLEQAIDNKVYKLYALTYEEVKIIDPLFGLSPAEYESLI